MKTGVLEVGNLIQGFKLSCQTEGKSPRTVEWYTSFLERFYQYLSTNDYPHVMDQIDRSHIMEFIRYLQTEACTALTNKPLSPATIQGYVRTLKAFFAWVTREEYIQENPMTKIPVPKAPIKVITTFNNEQITRLIQLCNKSNGLGHRNLAIMLLLLDSGLRVSELISIDIGDVNLVEGYIKIRCGKGNKERFVPIGSLVQKTLWKYINHHRPQPITQRIKRLFLSDYGMPLTKSGVQQMVRRYGKQANITGVRISCHTFRHTFAKKYLVNGGDIFSLQRILGHSSLASVRIYLNLFTSDIKKQHQRFSPVDNLAEDRSIYPFLR
jgi:site-specific recombinase XerD